MAARRSSHSAARANLIRVLPPFVAFVLVALLWQVAAAHNRFILASLSSVLAEIGHHPAFYLANAGDTMELVGVGLALSFGVAFTLAIAMVHVSPLERAVMPVAVVVNVTPVIAIAPPLILAFGYGLAPKYLITAIVTFFPILVNSIVGLRSIDSGTLDVLRTLHASRREVLWRLRLPSSLPFLFAAARVCLPLSVVGAVVAEFVTPGNQNGLGIVIVDGNNSTNLPLMYAAILCLAVIGVVLTVGVNLLERQLLSWHPSSIVTR